MTAERKASVFWHQGTGFAALTLVLHLAAAAPCWAQEIPKPTYPDQQTTSASIKDLTTIFKLEAERADKAAEMEARSLERSHELFLWIVSVVAAIAIVGGSAFAWVVARTNRSTVAELRQEWQRKLQGTIDEELDKARDNLLKVLRAEFDAEINVIRDRADTAINDALSNAAAIADLQPGQTTLKTGGPATSRPAPTQHSIIWVDDRPQSIEPIKYVLESRGSSVEVVPTTEALEKRLAEQHYDLIVSDMRRGGNRREGLDYFTRIKERADLPPRLIYTGTRNLSPYQDEIATLRAESPKFLGVATTPSDFFAMVTGALRGQSAT